jgi:hypothetical protein
MSGGRCSGDRTTMKEVSNWNPQPHDTRSSKTIEEATTMLGATMNQSVLSDLHVHLTGSILAYDV